MYLVMSIGNIPKRKKYIFDNLLEIFCLCLFTKNKIKKDRYLKGTSRPNEIRIVRCTGTYTFILNVSLIKIN